MLLLGKTQKETSGAPPAHRPAPSTPHLQSQNASTDCKI